MKQTGVYKIENTANGRFYIGSTVKNFKDRWTEHRTTLNRGKHRNHLLQEDWTKFGANSFQFIVLEVLPVEDVLKREQELLDQVSENSDCYNLSNHAIAGGGRRLVDARNKKRASSYTLKPSNLQWICEQVQGRRISASAFIDRLVDRARESSTK